MNRLADPQPSVWQRVSRRSPLVAASLNRDPCMDFQRRRRVRHEGASNGIPHRVNGPLRGARMPSCEANRSFAASVSVACTRPPVRGSSESDHGVETPRHVDQSSRAHCPRRTGRGGCDRSCDMRTRLLLRHPLRTQPHLRPRKIPCAMCSLTWRGASAAHRGSRTIRRMPAAPSTPATRVARRTSCSAQRQVRYRHCQVLRCRHRSAAVCRGA